MMDLSFGVLFTLGLPMLLGAWLLFDQLLETGELEKDGIDKQLKDMKKRIDDDENEGNPITSRWMKFGGGFYGLAALYTFGIIEILDISAFIMNFPGLSVLLADGIIALLVDILVGQIMNMVTAMIWFNWWGEEQQVLLNFAVAYGAYYAGMQLAKADLIGRWFR